MKKDIITGFGERLALAAISFPAAAAAYAMVCFFFGITIGAHTLLMPAAALAVISLFKDRRLFFAFIMVFALLASWSAVCGLIFDWSFDGMYYHKQAVITLKEGWDPLRQSSLDADVFASYPDMALWLDNYPKGLWTFSAAIYSITERLETAKAVNILFLIAVFGLAYDAMRSVFSLKRIKSAVFAVLFTINPVFICQLFTSYNDLAVGSCIIITALLCMKIYTERVGTHTYLLTFCTAALSCTIKFTAPVFVGIVMLVTGVCFAIKARKEPSKLKIPVAAVLAGFLTGIFLLGFDPYVKHIIDGQHIIYPVMGEGAYDIMNTNPPVTLEEHSQIGKLLVSLFSRTNNEIAQAPRLKIPFTVYKDEWEYLSNADIRIGGFGVLFSGILSLSLLFLPAGALFRARPRAEMCIFLCIFSALTLFFPESWWARYSSCTYYIPVLLLLYSTDMPRKSLVMWWRRILFALLAVNSALMAIAVVSTGIQKTEMLDQKLSEIKAENKKVLLRVNDFPSHVKLFSEYGIDFDVVHHALDDPEIFYLNTKIEFAE